MHRGRTTLLVAGGLVVLAVLVLLSLTIGAGNIPVTAVRDVLRGSADPTTRSLVLEYRWPRTLVAIAVGIALGVAGMLMQAFTRNPLADPGILGVNAGASLAVVVSISIFGLGSISDFVWPALLGALAAPCWSS